MLLVNRMSKGAHQSKVLLNNQVPMTVCLAQIKRLCFHLRPFTQTSPMCHVMKPMKGQGLFKWHFDGICVPPLTFCYISLFYFD